MSSSPKKNVQNIPFQTKQQQQLLDALINQAQSGLGSNQLLQGFDFGSGLDLFEQTFAEPAREQFQEQTLPALLQQFASSGQNISSPASQLTAAKALAQLESGLTGQAGQFAQQQQSNAINQLQSLLGLSGQRTFEPIITPSTQEQVTQGLGQGLGSASSLLPFLLI